MPVSPSLATRIATLGPVGFFPIAPGTAGSLAALALCWPLSLLSLSKSFFALGMLVILAVTAAHQAEKALGGTDPGAIVIDEVAGMAVTLFGVGFSFQAALLGFFLFRLLDIAKPFPIGWLERRTRGGVGIVLDDILAGIAANLILRGILAVFG